MPKTADMFCMKFWRTLSSIILFIGAGAFAMYWPPAVMGSLLAVALLGMALNREPHLRELDSDITAKQDQIKAAPESDFLKAA